MKPRPCKSPGCGAVATSGRFCDRHAATAPNRPLSAARRGYDGRWRRIRLRKLQATPYCERCDRLGITEPATEVHHIRPLREGGTHAADNLASLSTRCHRIITAIETESVADAIHELRHPKPRNDFEKNHVTSTN